MHAEKENRVHAYLHANLMQISPTSSLIHGLRHANKKNKKLCTAWHSCAEILTKKKIAAGIQANSISVDI
jgi:hypothetical protein